MKGFGESSKNNNKKSLFKNKSNLNQKKLITEASRLHSQGNILEAAKYYQLFLDKGFIDPNVLNNYGLICKQIGQLEKALKLILKQ